MRVKTRHLTAWLALLNAAMATLTGRAAAGRALLQASPSPSPSPLPSPSPSPLPSTCQDGSAPDANGSCFSCGVGSPSFGDDGACTCGDLTPCVSVPSPSPSPSPSPLPGTCPAEAELVAGACFTCPDGGSPQDSGGACVCEGGSGGCQTVEFLTTPGPGGDGEGAVPGENAPCVCCNTQLVVCVFMTAH